MTAVSDLDVNRQIRRVLVKHWLDLGRLSIRTSSGHVTIRGFLRRIPGSQGELTANIVESIFAEINRIKDVGRCTVDLTNWINASGSWMETGAEMIETHRSMSERPVVYNIMFTPDKKPEGNPQEAPEDLL